MRYFPYIKQNSIAEIVSTMESFLVAEVGFEPHGLRVMSPTSYQAALLRDIDFFVPIGAGDRGRTGTILSYHGILSPGRLPIPPFRRIAFDFAPILYHIFFTMSIHFANFLSFYFNFICLFSSFYETFKIH